MYSRCDGDHKNALLEGLRAGLPLWSARLFWIHKMTFKPGRPKGARNKLDAFAYEVALAHAKHKFGDPPPAEYEHTSLWCALDFTLKESPQDYTRQIIAMLPKQVSFESSLHSMEDDEIDNLITQLKERALEEKQAPLTPLMLEAPRVSNGHDQG